MARLRQGSSRELEVLVETGPCVADRRVDAGTARAHRLQYGAYATDVAEVDSEEKKAGRRMFS